MTTPWIIGCLSWLFGLCVGIVVMAVIADRTNKAEKELLKKEIYDNSVMYLSAVQTMEDKISEQDRQLGLKQRVMESLNEDVARLRRANAKLRRKEGCDD